MQYIPVVRRFRKLLRKNPEWSDAEDFRLEMKDAIVTGDGYNRFTFSDLNSSQLTRFMQPFNNVAWKQDVREINWEAVLKVKQFNFMIVDAPWRFVGSDPVRGPALTYTQLSDEDLLKIPLGKIIKDGFLFLWVIPSKEVLAKRWIEQEGFELCDRVTWIKLSEGRRMVTSLGLHFGKSKEDILIAKKGKWQQHVNKLYFGNDVLFDVRRGQSEKPKRLHQLIERNAQEGSGMIELFARPNNLRSGWTQIGLDLAEDDDRGYLTDKLRFVK